MLRELPHLESALLLFDSSGKVDTAVSSILVADGLVGQSPRCHPCGCAFQFLITELAQLIDGTRLYHAPHGASLSFPDEHRPRA